MWHFPVALSRFPCCMNFGGVVVRCSTDDAMSHRRHAMYIGLLCEVRLESSHAFGA